LSRYKRHVLVTQCTHNTPISPYLDLLMAVQRRQSNRSQGRQSSQSSSFPEQSSSPWYNRDSDSSPFHGSSQLSGRGSLSTVDTQEVRNRVIDLVNTRVGVDACQGGSNYIGYPDSDDERPSKRRYKYTLTCVMIQGADFSHSGGQEDIPDSARTGDTKDR